MPSRLGPRGALDRHWHDVTILLRLEAGKLVLDPKTLILPDVPILLRLEAGKLARNPEP